MVKSSIDYTGTITECKLTVLDGRVQPKNGRVFFTLLSHCDEPLDVIQEIRECEQIFESPEHPYSGGAK